MKANATKLIVRELMSTSVNRLTRLRMLGGTTTPSQHRSTLPGLEGMIAFGFNTGRALGKIAPRWEIWE